MSHVRDLLAGKEPEMPYSQTYKFRETLQRLGLMDRQSYFERYRLSYRYVASYQLAGLSYIVDHGHFKTRNTFVRGQFSVIMEDLN